MIKAVIFDFFGVLVTEGLKQFLDENFGAVSPERRDALDIVMRYDSGHGTYDGMISSLAKKADLPIVKVREALGDNQPNKLLLDHIQKDLKGKYKLGILSNSGHNTVHRILAHKYVDYFDDILHSYDVGMTKPHPEVYKLTAERLGAEPAECIFIDDTEGHCHGARRAGMKAIHYQNFHQLKKDLKSLLSVSDK